MAEQSIQDRYFGLLKAHVAGPEEEQLALAAELGRELVFKDTPPEEIAEIHEEAIHRLAQEAPEMTLLDAAHLISAPLMEMLMDYGLAFREQLEGREREEEARRKSEERFRKVIENIFEYVPEGLLTFTNKLNLFRINKAFQDVVQKYSGKLNYTEQELTEIIIEQVKNRIINEDYTEIRIPKKRG